MAAEQPIPQSEEANISQPIREHDPLVTDEFCKLVGSFFLNRFDREETLKSFATFLLTHGEYKNEVPYAIIEAMKTPEQRFNELLEQYTRARHDPEFRDAGKADKKLCEFVRLHPGLGFCDRLPEPMRKRAARRYPYSDCGHEYACK